VKENLINEFRDELHRLGAWWSANALDEENGGFVGEIDVNNQRRKNAEKGIILNSRILWFFSEVCRFTGNAEYKTLATKAYEYICNYFYDSEHGGVFWALDASGQCLNDRKQVYAQAFTLYGLSAYYRISADDKALEMARALFELIEGAHDDNALGYIEAFDRAWKPLDDMRLSDKDLNAPKTMNTHLHILEAYTTLYLAAPSPAVEKAMRRCLQYFHDFIIDHESHHLRMFQANDWTDLSTSYSYGHDIESSWLIWEAVEALGDEDLIDKFKPVVLGMADTVLRDGIGENGEVLDAYNFKTQTLLDERVWWVQAEGLVGFYYAYNISGEQKYYDAFLKVWAFIKNYQIDKANGEWFWLSEKDRPETGDYKVGFWKGPYHNGRAMMEICKLLAQSF